MTPHAYVLVKSAIVTVGMLGTAWLLLAHGGPWGWSILWLMMMPSIEVDR